MSEITVAQATENKPRSAVAETKLSDRQQKVLAFIRETVKARGYPPSLREIGAAVGLASVSTVFHHLKQLQKKGLITTPDPNLPRAYRVAEESPDHGVPEVRHVGCPLLSADAREKENDREVVLRVVLEPAVRRALQAGAQLTVQQLDIASGEAGTRKGWALLGQVTGVLHPLAITQESPEAAAAEASS